MPTGTTATWSLRYRPGLHCHSDGFWKPGAERGAAKPSLGSYTIFDLTRQKLGRSTVLHLPESDFGILHFRIAGPIPPESVVGLSVERLPAKPAGVPHGCRDRANRAKRSLVGTSSSPCRRARPLTALSLPRALAGQLQP